MEKLPQPVITYVAKEMRKVIQNDPDTYIDFLLFIQKKKGDNGKKNLNNKAVKYLMRSCLRHGRAVFLNSHYPFSNTLYWIVNS